MHALSKILLLHSSTNMYEYLLNDSWLDNDDFIEADEATMKEILTHYVQSPSFVLERVQEFGEVQLPKIIVRYRKDV